MDLVLIYGFLAVSLALNIWAFVACWQKGRKDYFWLSFLGIIIPFVGILHWIGAFRLAKPDSGWAQRHYDWEKMARARERFPHVKIV